MSFAQYLRFPLAAHRTAEFAERVAGRSRLAVWQRVKDGLADLTLAEARGYIRARALSVVKDETNRLIAQEGARVARIRERVETVATAALIETIVGQIASTQRVTHVRRAA